MSEDGPQNLYNNDPVPEGKELELYRPNHPPVQEDVVTVDEQPPAVEKEQPSPRAIDQYANVLTAEEMEAFQDLSQEEIEKHIIGSALGDLADDVPDAMRERLKSPNVWQVICKMKRQNMPDILERHPELADRMKKILGIEGDSADHEAPEGAPTGLPTTAEAVAASKQKSIGRRLAMKIAGGVEAIKWGIASPVAASQHLAWKFNPATRSLEWNEKFRSMTPKERAKYERRYKWRGSAIIAGLAIYAAYRAYGFVELDFSSGSQHHGTGPGHQPDHPGGPSPDHLPALNAHDYIYDPGQDPARSPLKHHNDWGPSVQASSADGDRTPGYDDFFNHRLKHSPEELSATLKEFGMNNGSVADLSNQMAHDPKLFEQKYNDLMSHLHNAKFSSVTDGRNYGSYYAVANPDGTVTVSYDNYVDASQNLKTYGPKGNDYTVVEINGEKHYFHRGCGYQPTHFFNTPAQSAPGPESAPWYNPTAYETPYTPPEQQVYSPPPPNGTPPPQSYPPQSNPPQRTPPQTPPTSTVPKGPTQGVFTPQGPGNFEPNGSTPVQPPVVSRPAPNGGSIREGFGSGNGQTSITHSGGVSAPRIPGPIDRVGSSGPRSGRVG